MKKIIIGSVILMAILIASSCTKSDILNNEGKQLGNQSKNLSITEKELEKYDFINPKWEIVDKNYKNDWGESGILSVNLNNKTERLFEVEKIDGDSEYYAAPGGGLFRRWKGIYTGQKRSGHTSYSCDYSDHKNCVTKAIYENGVVVGVELKIKRNAEPIWL